MDAAYRAGAGLIAMQVFFRVDASATIGTGHLHRCLTLAQALQTQTQAWGASVSVTFLSMNLDEKLARWVETKGITVQPLNADSDEAAQCVAKLQACSAKPDWLVVDHYQWSVAQEAACRPHVENILVIDDLANRPHQCDMLLDQNYFADPAARYQGLLPAHAQLLLGPQYALLKPEFGELRQTLTRRFENAKEILITFGGSDPGNNTLKVLEALAEPARDNRWRLRVVIGACHADREAVERLARQYPQCECLYDISDMAQKMAEADLFIGGGGTTTWERMALGLPGVVIAIADNQEALSQALAEESYQIYLGPANRVTSAQIRESVGLLMGNSFLSQAFSARGQALVDAQGAHRLAQRMIGSGLALRSATMADCEAVYNWRNDEHVRRSAFQSEPIAWETHRAWFEQSLQNPQRAILIGEINAQPVGVLRFDFSEDSALVSVYLVPGLPGKGYGTLLLQCGSRWLRTHRPEVTHVNAEIRPENTASRRAFEKAGYREYHLIYRLDLQHEESPA